MYLAQQQDAAGAAVVGRKAAALNGGTENLIVRDFLALWAGRFGAMKS
jgi:hypothetical protein